MERLLLWFLEGLAEGQGGPQARRREAPPKRAEPVCPPGRRAACGPPFTVCGSLRNLHKIRRAYPAAIINVNTSADFCH